MSPFAKLARRWARHSQIETVPGFREATAMEALHALAEAYDGIEAMDGPALINRAHRYTDGTNADLARLSGLTAKTISELRNGKSKVRPSTRSAIAFAIAACVL